MIFTGCAATHRIFLRLFHLNLVFYNLGKSHGTGLHRIICLITPLLDDPFIDNFELYLLKAAINSRFTFFLLRDDARTCILGCSIDELEVGRLCIYY